MNVLALNCGSSSVKAELYDAMNFHTQAHSLPLWSGRITNPGTEAASIEVTVPGRRKIQRSIGGVGFETAIKLLLNLLWSGTSGVIKGPSDVKLVGHRVVHGGTRFRNATVVNPTVVTELASLSELAPLHQPRCLQGIAACQSLFQTATHVAVFDTAFHSTLPPEAYIYPVPYEWFEHHGVRRYGFHGINHSYASRKGLKLASIAVTASRVITCHLGAGCSLAAILSGQSVRTTMGFTPLEGLMMATRSGSIDPGIVFHMASKGGMTPASIEQALNFESGLVGISGLSSDMREIETAAAQGDARAKLALDIFVDRVAASVASLIPALGGLDLLVFSGGIGENSENIRRLVCSKLACLGVKLSEEHNHHAPNDRIISLSNSPTCVAVIHAREEEEIAHQSLAAAPLGFASSAASSPKVSS